MPARREPSWGLLAGLTALAAATCATPLLASTSPLGSLPETVYTTDCDLGGDFCLGGENLELTANGRPVAAAAVCAERAYLQLDGTKAFEGLGTGPYEVIWQVAPGAYRRRLESRADLLDFLRASAPAASWHPAGKGSYRGLLQAGVGDLTIVDAATGNARTAVLDTVRVATDRSYRLPVGTYQLIATAAGYRDTTILYVRCTPTTRRDVRILEGTRGAHCLPAVAPADTYDVTVVEAPDATITGVTEIRGLCIEFEGASLGETEGVYERCHRPTGLCERYVVTFAVIPAADAPAPTPRDDYAAIAHNGQGILHVLANDETPGTVGSVVISQAASGSARVDDKHRIHYSAPAEWCGRDSLRYIVCTEGGCEEALVRIEVSCDRLIVFSGFSPNGDGANDAFTVLGLENYPDNMVTVFNEYGHQVFRASGYANDWEGTSHGSPLSEGTYYYVVQAAGFRTLSGYVQLQR